MRSECFQNFDNLAYQKGFVVNIEKISHEFLKYRNISQKRIMIDGSPSSGKSVLAQK